MKIALATCSQKPTLTPGDREFANELRRLGVEVSPLIWNDPEALHEPPDGIVVRSTWDYHKNSETFLKWIREAENVSRLFNSAQTIQWNLDKAYLLDLANKGVPCLPSLFIDRNFSLENITPKLEGLGWREVIIKPTISATSFLTFRSHVEEISLVDKVKKVLTHSNVLIQPYASSIEVDGELSLIFFKDQSHQYSHSVLKRPQRGEYRVQAEYGGKETGFIPDSELVAFADSALSQIPGQWIFARVDVMDWNKQPLISELELIEPDLFLQVEPEASKKLAHIIVKSIGT